MFIKNKSSSCHLVKWQWFSLSSQGEKINRSWAEEKEEVSRMIGQPNGTWSDTTYYMAPPSISSSTNTIKQHQESRLLVIKARLRRILSCQVILGSLDNLALVKSRGWTMTCDNSRSRLLGDQISVLIVSSFFFPSLHFLLLPLPGGSPIGLSKSQPPRGCHAILSPLQYWMKCISHLLTRAFTCIVGGQIIMITFFSLINKRYYSYKK